MERPLLNDKNIPVTDEVLEKTLGEGYQAYREMLELITGDEFGLVPEWRYYNDGKAWLCKMVFKKKTVFWLSVWDGYFKAAFYLVGRHLPGIYDLDIDNHIKEELKKARSFGTLFPVVMIISRSEQINDLLALIRYKKGLKG
jgi:hypothetical protein